MKCKVLHSVSSLRKAACLAFIIYSLVRGAEAQVVTVDFDYPNPIPPRYYPPDWRLPWHEDGYIVGSTNRSDLANITGEPPPLFGGSPPYPGVLHLFGFGRMSSVTITNETSLTFALISVDVVTLGLGLNSPTNYANFISSAGGVLSLLGTPDGSTVQFPNNNQWQNLTFLRIEFLTETFPAGGLQLDNFVLQTHSVPEPSVLAFVGSVAVAVVFIRRRVQS